MKFKDFSPRQQRVLTYLAHVPQKMLTLYDHDIITELVLYDLSREHCFNFAKAAYFVDNPDFNCLKGIAGVNRSAACDHVADVWDQPEQCAQYLRKCPFNNKVRTVLKTSLHNQPAGKETFLDVLAQDLGFSQYSSCTWQLKHGNHGILIFERSESDDSDQHLLLGLSLLGFCHIRAK